MTDRRERSMYWLTLAGLVVALVGIVGGYGLATVGHHHHPWQDVYLDIAAGMLAATIGLVGGSLRLRRPSGATPTESRLEKWLQGRIEAAEETLRQRPARGEGWYREAMRRWDVTNCQQLADGDDPVAPELLDNYRRSPRTGLVDGPGPPHDMVEYDRYDSERLAWCRRALRASREGTPITAPLLPAVPAAHRDELQAIASGLRVGSLRYERRASYHPPKQDGTLLLAESFQTHFPPVARMLDEWDQLLSMREELVHWLWSWIDREWSERAQPPAPALVYTQVIEAGETRLPWVQNDWLTLAGGYGIAQITDSLDVDAAKRPYDELLDEALATDPAAQLVETRRRIDVAKQTIVEQLALIEAQHFIRGVCDLCRVAVG